MSRVFVLISVVSFLSGYPVFADVGFSGRAKDSPDIQSTDQSVNEREISCAYNESLKDQIETLREKQKEDKAANYVGVFSMIISAIARFPEPSTNVALALLGGLIEASIEDHEIRIAIAEYEIKNLEKDCPPKAAGGLPAG